MRWPFQEALWASMRASQGWPTPLSMSPTSELLELAARAIRPLGGVGYPLPRLRTRTVYGRRDPARVDWPEFNCIIDPTPHEYYFLSERTTFHVSQRHDPSSFRASVDCGSISRAVINELTPEQIRDVFYGKPKEPVREPITQAKINRVFGLNNEAQEVVDDLTERGRNRLHAARLLKRWWYAHPNGDLDDEAKFIASLRAQGFEL